MQLDFSDTRLNQEAKTRTNFLFGMHLVGSVQAILYTVKALTATV